MNSVYPVPIPSSQATSMAYFYAGQDVNFNLGQLLKPSAANIFVTIDYSQIASQATVSSYNFIVDIASVPPLALTRAALDNAKEVLSFYIGGGLEGQVYKLVINSTMSNGEVRSDWIDVVVPGINSCCNLTPAQNPLSPNQLYPQGLYFISDRIQYFIGSSLPQGANVLDQWYNTATGILSEYISNGASYYWLPLNTANIDFAEVLTITATNKCSNLSNNPTGPVLLIYNKTATFINIGPKAAFNVGSGGAIIWNTGNTPYILVPGGDLEAYYDINTVISGSPANFIPPVNMGQDVIEALNVIDVNVLSGLSYPPDNPFTVELVINGQTFLPVGTNPPFVINGRIITWLSTAYSINPGDDVYAIYDT